MHKQGTNSKIRAFLACGVLLIAAACTQTPLVSKTATLSWSAPASNADGSRAPAIAGYRIYVGTDPNKLFLRGGIVGATTTSYVVSGLEPGTYYFAVSAVAESGLEGERSAVIERTL